MKNKEQINEKIKNIGDEFMKRLENDETLKGVIFSNVKKFTEITGTETTKTLTGFILLIISLECNGYELKKIKEKKDEI